MKLVLVLIVPFFPTYILLDNHLQVYYSPVFHNTKKKKKLTFKMILNSYLYYT